MFKHVNIVGIIILVVVLAVFHFGVGLVLSPAVKSVIVDKINETSGSKIEIENAHFWPLTLSTSLKGVKVYDPKRNEKIVQIKSASVRLSFWALLTKRIVFSGVSVNGAEIYLKREPDGSLNITKLGETKEEAEKEEKPALSIIDRLKGRPKEDWFGLVYNAVKKISSKKAVEKEKEEREVTGKVRREVVELPRGKIVKFKTLRDDYLFEIQKLKLKNALIHMEAEGGDTVDVEKAGIVIQRLAMDPRKGAAFDGLSAKGALRKNDTHCGDFALTYARSFSRDTLKTKFDINARNINMTAVKFIYEDSLPVKVERGTLDLKSNTRIVNGEIDSRNSFSLKGQELAVKPGETGVVGFIPMPVLINALNKIDPIKLKFDITGTLDSPQFSGFLESLIELVTPYIEDIKQQGIQAIKDIIKDKLSGGEKGTESSNEGGVDKTQQAIDSIKSLFGKEEQ
ncbi:AsmA family protein [Candidatus Omnitrophota bacterium]